MNRIKNSDVWCELEKQFTDLRDYDILNKRKKKEIWINTYNTLYTKEKERWDSMTLKEKRHELVKRGVESGIAEAKKHISEFIN